MSTPWLERAQLALYSGLQAMLLPGLLPVLALHPRLRGGLTDRFGWSRLHQHRGAVWLHGASAGDMVALQPLADILRERDCTIALSSWTRAGHQMAQLNNPPKTPIFRAPLDLRSIVTRVLGRLQPRLLVLECLEMWPHLVLSSQQREIPVVVVNGRLSSASYRGYWQWRRIFQSCFSALTLVTALSEQDAERFCALGTPPNRIHVAPSSKYSRLNIAGAPPSLREKKLVLGSIHDQEEKLLLPWLARLLAEVEGLRVTIAPRYPHRAHQMCRQLSRWGVTSSLVSAGGLEQHNAVRVVDTMGQLAQLYEGARVAFVGGSLIDHGGHNLMEPAARGVPVLHGPSTRNCHREREALAAQGASTLIKDGEEFYRRALQLLTDPASFFSASRAALAVAAHMKSEGQRVADLLWQAVLHEAC